MGKIVVSENTSLDGVFQDPTGEEGSSRGGWFAQVNAEDRGGWAAAALTEAANAEALLLGRRSYEFFAARWPSRSGPFAERLNEMPKYVVTSSPDDLDWHNSSVLSGDVVKGISGLKHELDGDVIVYASFQLVATLVESDLIDEVRLTIYPFVLGTGNRLFAQTTAKIPLRLVRNTTTGDNLVSLTYEITRDSQGAKSPARSH